MVQFQNSPGFAREMDQQDPLSTYRSQFYFPQHNGKPVIYFCGNSLGLQPKGVRNMVDQELTNWAEFAVEGHFKLADPWMTYQETLRASTSHLTGAYPHEVVVMGSLTANLHLLMVSFYRPTRERFKIICEGGAFPSDQYAFETQIRFHGFDPNEATIELIPRSGETHLRKEDILKTIKEHQDSLALVLFGGVNYYTGQVFDLESITKAGHDAGAVVGFDLAHAMGNIKLELHDWNVDFAAWCSYKYLNSGPGGVAGIFVHEKHAKNPDLPRFGGWWGNDPSTRFLMKKGFQPSYGADGWQLSNCPVLPMASLRASMKLFDESGWEQRIVKRDLLTGFLEFIIKDVSERKSNKLSVITPKELRGSQISVVIERNGKDLFKRLLENGVIADWREPDVIRLAPVPLYNNFEDIFNFGLILDKILD